MSAGEREREWEWAALLVEQQQLQAKLARLDAQASPDAATYAALAKRMAQLRRRLAAWRKRYSVDG